MKLQVFDTLKNVSAAATAARVTLATDCPLGLCSLQVAALCSTLGGQDWCDSVGKRLAGQLLVRQDQD